VGYGGGSVSLGLPATGLGQILGGHARQRAGAAVEGGGGVVNAGRLGRRCNAGFRTGEGANQVVQGVGPVRVLDVAFVNNVVGAIVIRVGRRGNDGDIGRSAGSGGSEHHPWGGAGLVNDSTIRRRTGEGHDGVRAGGGDEAEGQKAGGYQGFFHIVIILFDSWFWFNWGQMNLR